MIFNRQFSQVGGWQSLTIPKGATVTVEAHPNFKAYDPIVYFTVAEVQLTSYSCKFDCLIGPPAEQMQEVA